MNYPQEIESYESRIDDAYGYLHIENCRRQLVADEKEMAKPGFWDDASSAQELSKNVSSLRDTISRYEAALSLLDEAKSAYELSLEDEAFTEDFKSIQGQLQSALTSLEIQSWFSGQYDSSDAIITINPGQGGLESQDWTDMLYKMYLGFAKSQGWTTKDLDVVPGEGIGLDKATVQISGKFAYGMLTSEIGVHRLVRISPTDIKKRRHTTFASVEVLPVLPENAGVEIKESDVTVDVFRSSGPGGQGVNTTDSAVRLTHRPTGIVVTCQNERSQLQNKEAAWRVLRAKLFELEERKRRSEIDDLRGEKQESSFGSQIRNYVLYPFQLVKDTRSGYETSNVDSILAGNILDLVLSFHKWRHT